MWIRASTSMRARIIRSRPVRAVRIDPRPPTSVLGSLAGTPAIKARGAGLGTLRPGIRDGIREFRDGIRDAAKTATGHGDDRAGAGVATDAESSGQ